MKIKLLLAIAAIAGPAPAFAHLDQKSASTTNAVLQVDRTGHVNAVNLLKIALDDDDGVAACESECASDADFKRLQDCAYRDWASGRGDTCEQVGDIQEQDCRAACYENTQAPVYSNPPYPNGKSPGASDGKS